MSTIARIELYHVAVPLPATFYPSWVPGFPQQDNRFDLIRVITDDGVEGFSAGPAVGQEREGLGQVLAPTLLGEDATNVDLVQQRLRELGYLGWRNWWVEPAFWDIRGKLARRPVCELLGGQRRTVRLYASTGEVRNPSACIAEAEARFAEGFRTLKLRVHDFDERRDVAQVVETARAMGTRMKIAVDANQGWRFTAVGDAPRWDLDRARRFAEVCADAGVAWLEEPLPMDDHDALAALAATSRVPIAGGELETGGLPVLRSMIERRCYHVLQPDAVFTGGIAQTWEVARLCRQHGLGYTPHTWTNGIGFAINLQLMAASGFADERELEYPVNPPSFTVEARDGLLTEPFVHTRGEIAVPDRPGLGFEIDPRALERWGRRYFVMDRKRLVFLAVRDRGLNAARGIAAVRRARRRAQATSTEAAARRVVAPTESDTRASVVVLLPAFDYDPTEAALPWAALTAAGYRVRFATPDGRVAHADRRLTDTGFGPLSAILMTRPGPLETYRRMTQDPSFLAPLAYGVVRAQDHAALVVPGGHAPRMKTLLESAVAQRIVVDFFALDRPVGAICHGVLLLARSLQPDGRSVLYNRRTTALTRALELSAWAMTRPWLGDYYRTYAGTTVEQEVRAALADPSQFQVGPLLPLRDGPDHPTRGFTVRDGSYLSARWPGDAHRFSRELVELVRQHLREHRVRHLFPGGGSKPAVRVSAAPRGSG